MVKFQMQGEEYNHPFYVCSLATHADAILGTNFLLREEVTVSLEKRKIFLRSDPSSQQPSTVHQTQHRPVLTVFPTRVK
jgi:hypothetical protein